MGPTGLALPNQIVEASLVEPFPAVGWERYVQDFNPAEIGIVDREAAQRLTEKDLITCVLDRREEARRARSILEQDWDWLDSKYYLWTEDSDKEEWQSDLVVPEVFTKIRTARSLLQSALSEPDKFFILVKLNALTDDAQIRFIQDWIHYVQRDAHLLDGLLDMWEEALLLGSSMLKITYEDEIKTTPRVEMQPLYPPEVQMMLIQQAQMTGIPPPPMMQPVVNARPEVRQKIAVQRVPLRHAYPDPAAPGGDFYRGKFVVEEMEVFEEDMLEREAAGVYDSLSDIGEPMAIKDSYLSDGFRMRLASDQVTHRRRHVVTEYTGNIYSPEGRIIAKNWIVTVVNERAVVRVRPNPIWSGKTRYIWSTPVPFTGRVWGRPLVEADADIQEALSNLLNLMLVDVAYSVLGAFQIDELRADSIDNLETITPGMTIRGNLSQGDVIKKLQFPSNVNGVWPMMNYLQQVGDKSTQINEFVEGTPSSRGRPSATEVASKTQAGTAHMHNLARRLEENDVERSVQLIYEYLLQFGSDTSDPGLDDLLQAWGGPEALKDDLYRYDMLSAPFRTQVRGISMLMNREQLIARLMQLLQLTMQIGAPPPNQIKVLYTIISALGFSPEQLGYPATAEDMEMMMQQMAMAQQMGGAGAGGPLGQTPGLVPSAPIGAAPAPPTPDSTQMQMQQQSQASPMGGGA